MRSIENCERLISLDVSYNRIEDIEEGVFSRMPSVEHLDLKFNRLSRLPSDIESMKRLKYLSLFGNTMEALPTVLFRMESIELFEFEWERASRWVNQKHQGKIR